MRIFFSIALLLLCTTLLGEPERVIRAEGSRARLAETRSQDRITRVGRKGGAALPRERTARVPRTSKIRDLASELLSSIRLPNPLSFQPEAPKSVTAGSTYSTVIEGSFPESASASDSTGKPIAIVGGKTATPANGTTSIGFNDAAPDGRDAAQIPTNQNNRKGPSNNGGAGSSSGAQALPKWFALCMLIDPDIPDGNAIVKGVVEHAAKCGVVMEVFPFTIRQTYPNSPDAINAMAKKACNLPEVMGVENTAVSTVVRFTDTAGIMCGETENPESVAGCSEVGGGPKGGGGSAKEQKEKLERMKSSGHSGGEASGGIAANIVVRQGADADTAMHEIGHGILAEENGSRIGLGLGKGGGGGGGSGFNAEGCAIFQSSAFDNDGSHFYDPNRQTYYTKVENERFQRDLTENRSFFGEGPPGLPPIPPAPPQRPPGGDLPIGGAPPSQNTPPARPGSVAGATPPAIRTPASSGTFDLAGGASSKHKKGQGGGFTKPGAGNSASSSETALNSDAEFFGPSGSSETAITKSVGFNDEAEQQSEAITEKFFEEKSAEKPNEEPANRLLSSLGSGAEGGAERRGPDLGPNSESSAAPAQRDDGGATTGPAGEVPAYSFDTSGDDGFLDYVAKKTQDILDSEFFNGVFSGDVKREPVRRERDIRIIKGIY